jgi:GH35 family endo-1,4-beta-xylanase
MGTTSFTLRATPSNLTLPDLERICILDSYSYSPVPTVKQLDGSILQVRRDIDESGRVLVPWQVPGFGQLMNSTTILMEREQPYPLGVELARGKVLSIRSQLADWQMHNLQVPEALDQLIQQTTHEFGHALMFPVESANAQAVQMLPLAHRAAAELVHVYTEQLFRFRHAQHGRFDSHLTCRIDRLPEGQIASFLHKCFNAVSVPLTWRDVEKSESAYDWSHTDAVLRWAHQHHLPVMAGPLIDFAWGLPDWLELWTGDVPSLAGFMCDYVQEVVKRYKGHFQRWQLTAGSNNADALGLSEDDLVRLTVRIAEAAWQVKPDLELVLGLSQPWGEYLLDEEHTYSPFIFADTLLRAGLQIAALDLELHMGVGQRGTYCRDLLETSRMLDMYAMLGVPLQVSLAYPASDQPDKLSRDPNAQVFGYWRDGFTEEAQADWAAQFTRLLICKPRVRNVTWVQLSDAQPHSLPNCGLLDAQGRPRAALDRIRQLREEHLL